MDSEMRKLDEIAEGIRDLLTEDFRTIRISALQTSDQLLKEIRAINPDKLPGVIIVFDRREFASPESIDTAYLTLVLVDQFRAASDERAVSLFREAEKLIERFPPEGMRMGNNVWINPMDVAAASVDPAYAVLAVGIRCRQEF